MRERSRPQSVELLFGRGGGRNDEGQTVSLPVLRVETAGKHTVLVNGKIDRVDADEDTTEDKVVIDYKSARKKVLDLEKVLEGLDLQLPTYALVLQDAEQIMPLAALYFGLGMFRQRPAHAGEIKDKDDNAFYQEFQPRGMIDASRAFRLDVSLGDGGGGVKSPWYAMAINKSGELAKTKNDLLSPEDFATVLEYARWKIAQLADELMRGAIAPQPYRRKTESPCERCEFASLCPFDRVNGVYKELSSMKPLEAVAEMRAQGDVLTVGSIPRFECLAFSLVDGLGPSWSMAGCQRGSSFMEANSLRLDRSIASLG